MSEVIVQMEMPKSCDVCPCLDDYGDYPRCRISGEQRGYNFPIREKRMPNCPIVGVLPEQHGDLIDREYAVGTACSGLVRTLPIEERWEGWIRVNEVRESIKSAPTIVPATERSKT